MSLGPNYFDIIFWLFRCGFFKFGDTGCVRRLQPPFLIFTEWRSFRCVCPFRASRAVDVHTREVQERFAATSGGKSSIPAHQETVRWTVKLHLKLFNLVFEIRIWWMTLYCKSECQAHMEYMQPRIKSHLSSVKVELRSCSQVILYTPIGTLN